jgi:hypothetical protein
MVFQRIIPRGSMTTDLNREKRKSWHADAAVTVVVADNGPPPS